MRSLSFGERIKEQVLEVVIRQAIAGAPWKEICQGPMAVNNISDEEVQLHVDYMQKVRSQDTEIDITAQQRQNIADYVAEWEAIARSLQPFDIEGAQSAINALYEAHRLRSPSIVICESPVQLALFFELLYTRSASGELCEGRRQDQLEMVRSKLSELPAAVQGRFWHNLEEHKASNPALSGDTGKVVTNRMETAIWDEIIAPMRGEMLKRLSHDLIASLRLDLRRPLQRGRDALRIAAMEFEAPNAVQRDSFAFRTSPDRWGAWQVVDFLPYLFPVEFIDPDFYKNVVDYRKLKLWVDIARHAPSGIFCENVAFVLDRPRAFHANNDGRLHNQFGPAVAFKDGYLLYAWRGIIVPEDVIMSPESIGVNRIENTENVELRRAMTEIFGVARYLNESGAQLVQEDECGQLYSKQVPGDEPLQMVRVVNPTPEPDGTNKVYFLRVPPFVTTAREGVAWTFAVPPDEYEPLVQT